MTKVTKKEKAQVALTGNLGKKKSLGTRIWHNRYMYLLYLPLFIFLLVFAYYPMYGVTLAFKTYDFSKGIMHSPWADHHGLENFMSLFRNPKFFLAFSNTLEISVGRLVWTFPVPIILALLLNEIRSSKFQKVVQTIFTFPHFISWIIVFGLFFNLFADKGIVNQIFETLGLGKTNVLSNPGTFRPFLYISSTWKEMGWSAIIYLAAITGISPELYEAAKIDGASRRQLVGYITLPSIAGTIAVLFIFAIAGIMNAGFDQIFNMYNPAVQDVSDIIDTMIYRLSFKGGSNFGYTTAIGLFKSVISFVLLVSANAIIKKTPYKSIY